MPVNYKLYPDNWKEIRARILKRDGNCCKFCGLSNHAVGYRDGGGFIQVSDKFLGGKVAGKKVIRIVLTIAHLHDPDPWNALDYNLAALCQKCHNRHDVSMRVRNSAETRRRKKMENGQMELIP